MNIRKFRSDKDALIAEGNRIVSSSDDAKFIRKITIVNLLLRGMSAKLVADACGETDRTLSNWVRIVDEYGFGALRPRKQPGRPQCLTELQKENIKVAVASDPASFGYTVWDGPSLSDYIASQYGIPLCVRQCQRLLHELGFSLIRPQTFPSKGSEESLLREELKKTHGPRKRSGCSHMLPGRSSFSSFHGRIHSYPCMVSERQQPKSQVISRT